MPKLIELNDVVEQTFLPWRLALREDCDAYKGHVYRVLNFTCALLEGKTEGLAPYGEKREVEDRVAIAACFHDVGIWLDETPDYLEPSRAQAATWLEEHDRSAWRPEVDLMIDYHHKLTPYRGDHEILVETFRRADLVDVSLGTMGSGLPRDFIRSVKKQFPNAGFHMLLLRTFLPYMLTHPWKPLPMMRR